MFGLPALKGCAEEGTRKQTRDICFFGRFGGGIKFRVRSLGSLISERGKAIQ